MAIKFKYIPQMSNCRININVYPLTSNKLKQVINTPEEPLRVELASKEEN